MIDILPVEDVIPLYKVYDVAAGTAFQVTTIFDKNCESVAVKPVGV
jgi:hypothetical protein